MMQLVPTVSQLWTIPLEDAVAEYEVTDARRTFSQSTSIDPLPGSTLST
jgi:hypothetical protein